MCEARAHPLFGELFYKCLYVPNNVLNEWTWRRMLSIQCHAMFLEKVRHN